jgi:hypothetical protein
LDRAFLGKETLVHLGIQLPVQPAVLAAAVGPEQLQLILLQVLAEMAALGLLRIFLELAQLTPVAEGGPLMIAGHKCADRVAQGEVVTQEVP